MFPFSSFNTISLPRRKSSSSKTPVAGKSSATSPSPQTPVLANKKKISSPSNDQLLLASSPLSDISARSTPVAARSKSSPLLPSAKKSSSPSPSLMKRPSLSPMSPLSVSMKSSPSRVSSTMPLIHEDMKKMLIIAAAATIEENKENIDPQNTNVVIAEEEALKWTPLPSHDEPSSSPDVCLDQLSSLREYPLSNEGDDEAETTTTTATTTEFAEKQKQEIIRAVAERLEEELAARVREFHRINRELRSKWAKLPTGEMPSASEQERLHEAIEQCHNVTDLLRRLVGEEQCAAICSKLPMTFKNGWTW